jgi:hypothetical protein
VEVITMNSVFPSETIRLCDEHLHLLDKGLINSINAVDRLRIYNSWGSSRLSKEGYSNFGHKYKQKEYVDFLQKEYAEFQTADHVLAWLSIITAKFVLPVWDGVWQQLPEGSTVTTAQQIISTAENLLLHKTKFNSAYKTLIDYSTARIISNRTTYDVCSAFDAAYYALELIIRGIGVRNKNQYKNSSSPDFGNDNFVMCAVQAYSIIDKNSPGNYFDEEADEFKIETDYTKQVIFWEWWLTEAIPQAWELGTASFNTRK